MVSTRAPYEIEADCFTTAKVTQNESWSRSYDFYIYKQKRCRLERWFNVEENLFFCFQSALGYSWRCEFLHRWRCNSRS
jgi:hypothetical protein